MDQRQSYECYDNDSPKPDPEHPCISIYGIFTYIYHKRSTNCIGKYLSSMDGMGQVLGKCREGFLTIFG